MGFFKKKQVISVEQMAQLNYDSVYYALIENIASSENISHILSTKKSLIKKKIVDLLVLYYQINNNMVLTKTQQSELTAHIFYFLSDFDNTTNTKDKNKVIKLIIDLIKDNSINSISELQNRVISLVKEQKSDIVVANVIDPSGGVSIADEYESDVYKEPEYIRREYWEVGVHISNEAYSKFLDSFSNELYVIFTYINGVRKEMLTTRQTWIEMKNEAIKI
jgi:hypothetical protein